MPGETLTLEAPGSTGQTPQARTGPTTEITIEAPETQIVPNTAGDADALRETREALAALQTRHDTEAIRARNATAEANRQRTEAARARDELARANTGRVSERRTALATAVQAADADLARAKTAVQTAGEAGDYAGLAEAQELIASARYRKDSAAAELAGMGDPATDTQPRRQQPQHQNESEQPAPYVPGPRVRQWLDENPEMMVQGSAFRSAALAAHDYAIKQWDAESDQYFDHINRAVAGFKPAKPPQQPARQQEQPMPQQNGGGSTSQAAPSNRGGGGSLPSGWKQINTLLGPVNVQDTNGGGMRFNFQGNEIVHEHMEEGAQVCYPDAYQKDPKQAVAMYTRDQVQIARERAAGGTGGLTLGDGATYR